MPKPRKLIELMPAAPELRLLLDVDGVVLPDTDGNSFTKSARFTGAAASISASPITVTGVGVSYPLRATREPVTTTSSSTVDDRVGAGAAGEDSCAWANVVPVSASAPNRHFARPATFGDR